MKQRKRIAALLMAVVMLFSSLPVSALGAERQNTGSLCEHHPAHTAECGYAEGTEGASCNHQHTDECYTFVINCVHEHGADCYPAEGVSDNAAAPSGAETAEPTACTHQCSEESGCITKELDCQHEHDSECGYTEAVPGTPCTFVCEECKAETGDQEKDGCICDALCTDDAINTDCPVCGVVGADLTACEGRVGQKKTQQILLAENDNDNVSTGDVVIGECESCQGHTITGESSEFTIRITGGEHNITLQDVKIDASGCAFALENDAVVNLTLAGINSLKSGSGYAGLQVPDGTQITINGSGNASLTVQGGSQGAGIGGGKETPGGSITIRGGAVQAIGGNWAAAIGDGDNAADKNPGTSANITIAGGKVTLSTNQNSEGGCLGYADDAGATGGSISITGGELLFRSKPAVKVETITGISGCILTLLEGDTSLEAATNCLLIQGNTITVRGTYTLQEDFTLDTGETLEISAGATFGTGSAKLTNNGTILLNEGTLTVNSYSGSGTVYKSGSGTLNGTAANAVSPIEACIAGDFLLSPNTLVEDTDYAYENNTLTILNSTPVTISGSTTADKIVVDDSVAAKITIDGLSITSGTCAFTIPGDASAEITLVGDNTLKSGENCAGLAVEQGGTVTIGGAGSLQCTGGSQAAGIGGGYTFNAGTINITGGTIIAQGGNDGAGIGGGHSNDSQGNQFGLFDAINITGGMIDAYSPGNAAAIGTGCWAGNGSGPITIENAQVTANTTGSYRQCAAIGRGISSGDNNCQVTIKNSIVSAQNVSGNSISGENGVPAIENSIVRVSEGSDNDNIYVAYGDCETPSGFTLAAEDSLVIPRGASITVPADTTLTNGGAITNLGTLTVTGTLYNNGTLINQSTGSLNINGTLQNNGTLISLGGSITGDVTGTPAENLTSVPYRVYDEAGQKWGEKTCSDFNLVTLGLANWPAGWYVASGQITIPSRVTASGDIHLILLDNCELTVETGISVADTGTLHIYSQSHGDEMGKLTVTTGGITGGTIVIDGGNIKSTGGYQGPGIGGSEKKVVIHGGSVEAVAGAHGAGIGGDDGGSGGEIIITGGTVTATSIGGGSNGSGGSITIDGGTIHTGIIGGQGIGSSGTFAAGGNAVIYTSEIKDITSQDNWNGVIFEGADGEGTVYGKVSLQENLTVTDEQTLTVPAGSTFIIPEGVTVTCNGTLTNEGAIQVFGKLIINGTASNSGVILPVEGSQITGTITGNQPGPIEPVSYLACNEETGQDWEEKTCELYLPITESTTELKSGWYVARGEITINTGVVVTGNVHLILADGCVLTVGGISVSSPHKLHIYSQSEAEGMGRLISNGSGSNAAIGGTMHTPCGSITINGGDIEAHGNGGAAGIGGGKNNDSGSITINGGKVLATTTTYSGDPAAIGGASANNGNGGTSAGTIVINGGMVTANGCAKGIGGGVYNTDGTITITGGVVTANGIGTGGYGGSTATTISGGVVFSSGGINETNKDNWSGLIVNNGMGGLCGADSLELAENTEIPDWAILTIENGQTLTVPAGVTLTNRGNIFLYGGALSGDGTIRNNGVIFYTGEKPSEAAGVWIPIEAETDVIRLRDISYNNKVEISGSSCEPCKGHIIFGTGEDLDRAITVDGGCHNIILRDVKLKVDGWPFKCAFELQNGAEIALTLVGENSLESIENYAGLQVPQGTKLTINAIEDASLTAKGGQAAAGIGGGQRNKGGTITINSGNIQATAGSWAAAIGGGDDSNGSGDITINGGKITLATGGSPSSGCLGYGDDPGASGGSVTITGGELVFQNGPFIKNETTSIRNCKITLAEGDYTLDLDVVEQSVVYQGGTTTLCGTFTLDSDKTLADGKDLVIYKGATLEIPAGKKLSVAGTLTNNGQITGSGTLGDSGGSLEGSGMIAETITNEFLKKSDIAINITPTSDQVTYGSAVSITATVSAAPVNAIANVLRQAAPNQMVFFVGAGDDKTLLGTVPVNNGSATLPDVVISADKGFSAGNNTITAEYGGSMTLPPKTGTATLTVKARQLSTPGNPHWDDTTPGRAVWDAVENADGYSVQLYKNGVAEGTPVEVTDTAHQFSTTGAGTYTFKVYAVGTGNYSNSLDAESGNLTFYAVSFETDGGSPEPEDQCVLSGNQAEEPEVPSKNGHIFQGWYKDDTLWDFDNEITDNITLTAKWEKEPVSYISYQWDENAQKLVRDDKETGQDYTLLDNDSTDTNWTAGRYVVEGTVNLPSRVTVNGNVHLILKDGCHLNAGSGGIQVETGSSLTIYAQSEKKSTMGSLTATGGNQAAGIGGNSSASASGIITIHGGIVTATGGERAAGIGGGRQGAGKTITINGGIVIAIGGEKAEGGDGGAGIGGGQRGTGENITINGGIVSAKGGSGGAGIGGGNGLASGGAGKAITINGGTVTAEGGDGGAGIGGGDQGAGETITIKGGTVTATGGDSGAGIGGGHGGAGEGITINGGKIDATGRGNTVGGAGIGGGAGGTGKTITIEGGIVTAEGGNSGAGIGGGYNDAGEGITIKSGTVTATGGFWGAGIGGGHRGTGETIIIEGGTVTAEGGSGGAGIGGGCYSAGKYITIKGGTVTATGGYWEGAGDGAGIGDGYTYNVSSEDITITNGSVKASSISITPTDGNGTSVYLAKLAVQSGVNEVTLDSGTNEKTFQREGDHPDGDTVDTTFYLYLTGQDHEIVASNTKYKAIWNGSDGFTIKLAVSAPTVAITTTASSITVTELANKDTYGGAEYKLGDGNWQDSNVFNNLPANKTYTVYARYKGNDTYAMSDTGTLDASTSAASYTITIPATNALEAGNTGSSANIAVNTGKTFDLGYNGHVDVKVKNDGNVTRDAKLKLKRQNDANTTITSALLVNGTALRDINKSVATFKTKTDTPVSISFASPTETNILAGTYTGTINFVVTYSEQ